ncbi:MAG TPA: VOC family protein [Puia sp.]|nr:VOC family protein [Puia sp.]
MTPESAATIFNVSDLASAVNYYVEVLGFKIAFRYGEFAGLEYGNVLVYLSGPGHEGIKRAIGQGQLYIFCDEVDKYFQDISAKGALVMAAPGDRAYGMRDFGIRDPDDNVLSFGKGLEAEQ